MKVCAKILNFWHCGQRVVALLAGGICMVSAVSKETEAALALRSCQRHTSEL
jgi:hypothetical protein